MAEFAQLKDLKGIEVIEVKQFEDAQRDRPDFKNVYLKVLYFILREGIISTSRKYFAIKSPQKRYLTFVFVRFNQKRYVNVSVQFNQEPTGFVIINKFYISSDINFENIYNNIDYYLCQFNQFAEIENYELLGIDVSDSVSFDVIPPNHKEKYNKGLFIYGLGRYVKIFIIQHFKNISKIACTDYNEQVVEYFKTKYGFKYGFVLSSNSFPLLSNVYQPVVIIATFHSDHASLAYEVFNRNPNAIIFIEKPPTVTLDDLNKLIELYNKGAHLEIGFNRRFIGYNKYVKVKVKNRVVFITCLIKEALIAKSHWYLWKNQGTRITGNAVHWFDLANFWIDSIPVEINLLANLNDSESSAISVLYKNGSILNITITDKGNSLRGVQEKFEIRFGDETIFIDDYLSLTHIKQNGIRIRKWKLHRDKGHNVMYENFLRIIERKKTSEYRLYDLIRTSLVTYYASEMLSNNIRNMNIENEVNKYLGLGVNAINI